MKKNNTQLAYELKNETSKWVDTFNFLSLDTVNAICKQNNEELIESILYDDITWEDIADYVGCTKTQAKKGYKKVEDHPNYDDVRESQYDRNYPMWNTLFEFKEEPTDGIIEAAQNAGIGIIRNCCDFNTMLFFSGCGYSFYGAHWIPMFLELPWNSDLKKKYKNIDYSCV